MKNSNEEKFMDDDRIVEWTCKKLIERTKDPNIKDYLMIYRRRIIY